jgi:hypothetical protein
MLNTDKRKKTVKTDHTKTLLLSKHDFIPFQSPTTHPTQQQKGYKYKRGKAANAKLSSSWLPPYDKWKDCEPSVIAVKIF